jgi:hypothetical protein
MVGNSNFFRKYRDYILLNRNLLMSGTCGFFAGALAAQLYKNYDENVLANSVVSLAAEYAAYIPIFAYLFYNDNKHRYVDPLGHRISKNIWNDLKKLFATFSVSEIIYSVTRGYVHYQILVMGTEPYQAAMIASFIAWAAFLACVNIGAKLVRLFKVRQE